MTKSIRRYAEEYMEDYGFEAEMVRYRAALVNERLQQIKPRTVIELGCGQELQARRYFDHGGRWACWVIVEPSETFADVARQETLPELAVVEDFFENVEDGLPTQPDLILCSGLLHEVPDADLLLGAISRKMGPETRVHISVPNASSFHRRLAHSMGLIEDFKTLSERNTALQQPRVYDLESLQQEMSRHGLQVEATGGYLVKPFTHTQMQPLVDLLGREVMDGLFALGKSNPGWASEIYVEAKLA